MDIFRGRSFLTDAQLAVSEVTQGWDPGLDIVFAFSSTKQDPTAVAEALSARFPGVPVVGCSSTGEHLDGEHSKGSLVAMGLKTPKVRWATAVLSDMANLASETTEAVVGGLFEALEVDLDTFEPEQYFCLCFVDGLCMKEEAMAAQVADALKGIALLGGSAGDDLKFESTCVFHDGKALSNATTLVLAHSEAPFEILKHQHFTTTPNALVVTRVDTDARRIYELDGYPAIEAYANALGLAVDEVDGDVTFMNPVTFSCNGELYVRSIQRLEDDGSIVFYCGVEEGMVLEIGGHKKMPEELGADMARLGESLGEADLIIAFNCILRALEADKGSHHAALGGHIKKASRASIGFDTYGEQLNGLHINQTMVAVALGSHHQEAR